jgi:hypothetical protein
MARLLRLSVPCAAVLMIAAAEPASAQRCPPNSHAQAVAIPGNLRTAQCFCDPGFISVNGLCVRPAQPSQSPPPSDPARSLVAPMPFR